MLLKKECSQILLVEDDSAIMETLAIFLQYEGYDVLKARSVERTLELLREETPDLVLLDYMLQDDTAEPVVRVLRESHAQVPILLLTAADDPSGKARNMGTDGVIAKPFELDSLLATLREALSRLERQPDTSVISTGSRLLGNPPIWSDQMV